MSGTTSPGFKCDRCGEPYDPQFGCDACFANGVEHPKMTDAEHMARLYEMSRSGYKVLDQETAMWAHAKIKELQAIPDAIEFLRKDGGDAVEIFCTNSDFFDSRNYVTVDGNYLGWNGRCFQGDSLAEVNGRCFQGDSLAEVLDAAVKDRREAEAAALEPVASCQSPIATNDEGVTHEAV